MGNYYVNEDNLGEKTNQWLENIKPFNTHRLILNVESAALLVIDMQNFFLDPASPTFVCGGLAILNNVKKMIEHFRQKARPVLYTRHEHHAGKIDTGIMGWWWEGMCVEGTPESLIDERIAPAAGDKVIAKHRYSAFYNTDLETVLRCMKIEDLVISGIMTNMCCESTARDAYYRDYRVFFPADATGAVCEEMHLSSLLNLAFGFASVTTTKDIIEQL